MNVGKLIRNGESEKVEFKEKFGKEAIQTVVAFANTYGGYLLIGVNDKGKVKGVKVGKETLKNWYNEIIQNIEPKINFGIRKVKIGRKQVVIIEVPEAPIKPVSYKGRCYKRVKNSNKAMLPSEIAELHNFYTGKSWDALECEASIKDLDRKKVEEYLRLANSTGRRKFKEDWLTVLKKLGLVKKKATWAAILLFGKEPQRFLLASAVHCGKFKHDKTIILDDLMIETDLVNAVDEVMKFIMKHISVRYEFEGKPRRKEVWEYPLEALREAVINAIVHRDYRIPANIQVEIYDDRIEIWSPGKLPPGISIEDLYKKEHQSVIRNQLIAQVFYDIGFIEKYGSGTAKIIELCKKHGLPLPEFKEVFNGFMVIFRKDVYTEEYLKKLGLNERQIKAVFYVKEKGKITNKEYQKLCGVKKRQATNDLKELESKGIFERIGTTGKGVYYTLKGQERGKTGIEGAGKGQIVIKYFCEEINPEIRELLEKIKEKHGINFEIVQNKPWDEEKDKEVYEKYFKPRAKVLRKRTGKPVTKLRSRRARHYFISIPGTIALFVDDKSEYWEFATEEGVRFLEDVLEDGEWKIKEILRVRE